MLVGQGLRAGAEAGKAGQDMPHCWTDSCPKESLQRVFKGNPENVHGSSPRDRDGAEEQHFRELSGKGLKPLNITRQTPARDPLDDRPAATLKVGWVWKTVQRIRTFSSCLDFP